MPCNKNGNPLAILIESNKVMPVEGVEAVARFSTKPVTEKGHDPNGYPDYYAKLTTYIKILEHEAQAIDPTVTARVFPLSRPTMKTRRSSTTTPLQAAPALRRSRPS